jgi:hypothetical protein
VPLYIKNNIAPATIQKSGSFRIELLTFGVSKITPDVGMPASGVIASIVFSTIGGVGIPKSGVLML